MKPGVEGMEIQETICILYLVKSELLVAFAYNSVLCEIMALIYNFPALSFSLCCSSLLTFLLCFILISIQSISFCFHTTSSSPHQFLLYYTFVSPSASPCSLSV